MQLYFVSEKGHLIKINKLDFEDKEVYVIDDNRTIYVWFGRDAPQTIKDAGLINARKLDKSKGYSAKLLLLDQGREYGAFLAMMDDLKGGISEEGVLPRRPELKELEKVEDKYVRYYLVETLHNIIDEMKDPRYKFEKIPESFIEEQVQELKFRDVREIHWEKIKSQLERKIQMAINALQEEVERKEEKELELAGWVEEHEKEKEPELEEWIEEPEKIKESELEEWVEEPEEEKIGLEDDIRLAAYFLSREGFNYDELCWLLAEKIIMAQQGRKDVSDDDIKPKSEEIFKTSCTYDELCWLNAEMDILILKKYIEIE